MEKLKPCPFCGGEAFLEHGFFGITQTSFVKCGNFQCGIKGKTYQVSAAYTADELAIEAWNRRTP